MSTLESSSPHQMTCRRTWGRRTRGCHCTSETRNACGVSQLEFAERMFATAVGSSTHQRSIEAELVTTAQSKERACEQSAPTECSRQGWGDWSDPIREVREGPLLWMTANARGVMIPGSSFTLCWCCCHVCMYSYVFVWTSHRALIGGGPVAETEGLSCPH